MLVYHPAFDLYACIFRMLNLLSSMRQAEVEIDRLRIWDFYLTFPNQAKKITFPSSLSELKKVFKKKEPNPYEDLIDPKKIFERMKSYQLSALRCIASYGFIDGDLLSKNIVKRTDKIIPDELVKQFELNTDEKNNIIKLVVGFSDLVLFGDSGLKARTGLLDFKHDPR